MLFYDFMPRKTHEFAQFVRLTLVPAANALKITRFLVIPARLCVWPSYLCSGIPFHSSN